MTDTFSELIMHWLCDFNCTAVWHIYNSKHRWLDCLHYFSL